MRKILTAEQAKAASAKAKVVNERMLQRMEKQQQRVKAREESQEEKKLRIVLPEYLTQLESTIRAEVAAGSNAATLSITNPPPELIATLREKLGELGYSTYVHLTDEGQITQHHITVRWQ